MFDLNHLYYYETKVVKIIQRLLVDLPCICYLRLDTTEIGPRTPKSNKREKNGKQKGI